MRQSFGVAIGILLAILVLYFGIAVIIGNTALDIQLHDTYYVLEWRLLILLFTSLVTFVLLMSYVIFNRFEKLIANVLLLFIISFFVIYLTTLSPYFSRELIFDASESYQIRSNPWNKFSLVIICIQGCLLLLLAYVSFKSALAYKNKP